MLFRRCWKGKYNYYKVFCVERVYAEKSYEMHSIVQLVGFPYIFRFSVQVLSDFGRLEALFGSFSVANVIYAPNFDTRL